MEEAKRENQLHSLKKQNHFIEKLVLRFLECAVPALWTVTDFLSTW